MNNNEIIGSISITNNLALEVYNYESNTNKIVYNYSDENKFRKAKLYENKKGIYFNTPIGRTYLNICILYHYLTSNLNEIMRINY